MCLMEKELTKNTIINGYNIIIGGFDNEERRGASAILRDKLKNDLEFKSYFGKMVAEGSRGRVISDDTRKKMSDVRKGRKWKPDWIENRRIMYSGTGNPNAGKYSTYLNINTGIYYETPEILTLLGISRSSLIKYNKANSKKMNDFIKV